MATKSSTEGMYRSRVGRGTPYIHQCYSSCYSHVGGSRRCEWEKLEREENGFGKTVKGESICRRKTRDDAIVHMYNKTKDDELINIINISLLRCYKYLCVNIYLNM